MAEEQPKSQQPEEERLLFSMIQYEGEFSPQNLAFNANLQEFAQRVDYIYAIYRENEITASDAYQLVEQLWKELSHSKKGLGI